MQSVVKQSLVRSTSPVLTVDDLPPEFRGGLSEAGPAAASPDRAADAIREYVRARLRDDPKDLCAELVTLAEREVIAEVLRHTNGNLSRASVVLGIARPTLRTKIAALGLQVDATTTVTRSPAPKG